MVLLVLNPSVIPYPLRVVGVLVILLNGMLAAVLAMLAIRPYASVVITGI